MEIAFGIAIAVVVISVIVWMMTSHSPPDEERHCFVCRKATRHHPEKGCRECEWAERQW